MSDKPISGIYSGITVAVVNTILAFLILYSSPSSISLMILILIIEIAAILEIRKRFTDFNLLVMLFAFSCVLVILLYFFIL